MALAASADERAVRMDLHLPVEEIVQGAFLGKGGYTKSSAKCDILQHFGEACLVMVNGWLRGK